MSGMRGKLLLGLAILSFAVALGSYYVGLAWTSLLLGLYGVGLLAWRRNLNNNDVDSPRRLAGAPGWRLRRLAKLCFGDKSYQLGLEPALSDLEHEYFLALSTGNRWSTRSALLRGYWAFWRAFFAKVPFSLLKLITRLSLIKVLASLWKAAN